jgi:nitronate monooxygenase
VSKDFSKGDVMSAQKKQKSFDVLGQLRLPVVAAPMFLSSGPDLVVACCTAGVVGTFPAHNRRDAEGFEEWVVEVNKRLAAFEAETGQKPAPFGVNLIVHKTNAKLEQELAVCIKHKVPIIITSLGAVSDLVDAVHGYGGVVWHDIINLRHAKKAAEAGVDGLIAVSAGAGGHTGLANPFGLVHELREFYDGVILLSGSISNGSAIAASQVMGANLSYMGTRFIATKECMSDDRYKDMLIQSCYADIITTAAVTGVNATFIARSLEAAGVDVEALARRDKMDIGEELTEALGEGNSNKPWRDIWSAGHGVGGIEDAPSVEELILRLEAEYHAAIKAQFGLSQSYGWPPYDAK